MNRRMLMVLSTAVIVAPPIFEAKAQSGGAIRPTGRQVANVVHNVSQLERTLVAVDALRLNLLLTRSRDDFFAAYSSEAITSYEAIKRQVREGAAKLKGQVEATDRQLEPLPEQLQQVVQIAATRLLEAGLREGSNLYNEQVESFWTVLFIVTESGQRTATSLWDWLCGSNPFDVLCGR